MKRHPLWSAVVLFSAGCSSISSTMLNRLDDDSLVKNQCPPIHGIPVMLPVPTHLEVAIREVTYWKKRPSDGILEPQEMVNKNQRHLDVTANIKYTEKMFVMDPVRPAAGNVTYDLEFQSSKAGANAGKGYLRQFKYKAEDETIQQTADLVATVAGLIQGRQTDATKQQLTNAGLYAALERTIAFRRFDINAPDFEYQVTAFLDTYLNACHTCVPDGKCEQEARPEGNPTPMTVPPEPGTPTPSVEPEAAPTPATPTTGARALRTFRSSQLLSLPEQE